MPPTNRERIVYVANSLLASLQISFIEPVRKAARADVESEVLTEADLVSRFPDIKVMEAERWVKERIARFNPTLIVFCRYSGPHAPAIVAWAREAGVPTIFHIDDDLLNVPLELGASKYAVHNHPDRIATVRYLLAEATVAYCSTEKLRQQLFGDGASERVVAGAVYCAHDALAGPGSARPPVVGYMGSDHRSDFKLVLPTLVRLLTARPELTFEMFSSMPMPNELMAFGARARKLAPVAEYASFMERLAALGWTVGLCPLAQTPFNAVKADTKWVEYTACGFAVVASRGTVYDRCCAEGCGLLVDGENEWLNGIELLLDDDEARTAQVNRAQGKLRAEYRPETLMRQIEAVFDLAHRLENAAGRHSASRTKSTSSLVADVSASISSDERLDAGADFSARPGQRADAAVPEKTDRSVDHLKVEALAGNLVHGWAWSPGERGSSFRKHRPVELWCGNVRIGVCARDVERAKVDALVDDSSSPKGFRLPAGCLNALWPLMRKAEGLRPGVSFGSKTLSLYDAVPLLRDATMFRTLRSVDTDQPWQVRDAWWADSRVLKLRTEAKPDKVSGAGQTRLRAYQPMFRSDGDFELSLVDEVALEGRRSTVAALNLRSPVMPLLLVGCDGDEQITFTDLVPFPSLLRGGLHESEVAALGRDGGTLGDLRRISDSYVAEAVGWRAREEDFTVKEIGVDLSRATGAEPIFDPEITLWLGQALGVRLTCENGEIRRNADFGDEAFVEHAEAQLARYRPDQPRPGRHRLSLPSHAIPTIAVLVSRRITASRSGRIGPYIVVGDGTARRRSLIRIPGSLDGADAPFKHAFRDAPVLSALQTTATALNAGDNDLPLAVGFRDLQPPAPVQLLFPVPKDQDRILGTSKSGVARVTVLAFTRTVDENLNSFLASVGGQLTSGTCELVLAVSGQSSGALRRAEDAVARALAGRGAMLELDPGLDRSAALNRAAESASGDCLVIADTSVLLHDFRTIETLAVLTSRAVIGTAGCMLLTLRRPADVNPIFVSAGYFPARIDFSRAPHLAVSELDCTDILPDAIYPVAANSPHLFAISADAWDRVGGFDATNYPLTSGEIDLAFRLAALGFVNVCTTKLSAFLLDAGEPRRLHDLQAISQLSFWDAVGGLKASTLIREL